MTGRGIDQALPHPCDPILYEDFVRDARDYVRLAETASGPIARPLDLWGDALPFMKAADVRIVNLETSITTSPDAWPDKGINYRMHPANVACLQAAGIDGCALANNHVLDWGYAGLAETLATLDEAGIAHAGAGSDLAAATTPAVLDLPGRGRVLLGSYGLATSGIPPAWAAGAGPGVAFLPDLSDATARTVWDRFEALRRPGDLVVISLHWGPNWGYEVPSAWTGFAHRLVEAGAAVVHGHSSHHVMPIEIYRDRPILYGCGDFLNDYEGIEGYEAFRPDLRLLYLLTFEAGRLQEARLVPLKLRRFRLEHVGEADERWLADLLGSTGTRVTLDDEGFIRVCP
jgi:poly-gamma-glutamate synthesis protein (capsule biosynthesis protein)